MAATHLRPESIVSSETNKVSPIQPYLRPRGPHPAAQKRLLSARADWEAAKAKLAELGPDEVDDVLQSLRARATALERMIPAFNLRIVVSNQREVKFRWREALLKYKAANAEKDAASYRYMLELETGGATKALRARARNLADAVRTKALDKLMSVPAPGENEIAEKRKLAGKRWLSKRPDWQALVEADEERLLNCAR